MNAREYIVFTHLVFDTICLRHDISFGYDMLRTICSASGTLLMRINHTKITNNSLAICAILCNVHIYVIYL